MQQQPGASGGAEPQLTQQQIHHSTMSKFMNAIMHVESAQERASGRAFMAPGTATREPMTGMSEQQPQAQTRRDPGDYRSMDSMDSLLHNDPVKTLYHPAFQQAFQLTLTAPPAAAAAPAALKETTSSTPSFLAPTSLTTYGRPHHHHHHHHQEEAAASAPQPPIIAAPSSTTRTDELLAELAAQMESMRVAFRDFLWCALLGTMVIVLLDRWLLGPAAMMATAASAAPAMMMPPSALLLRGGGGGGGGR